MAPSNVTTAGNLAMPSSTPSSTPPSAAVLHRVAPLELGVASYYLLFANGSDDDDEDDDIFEPIASRLKGRRLVPNSADMSRGPIYERISYREMEPVHYRLLEGTYLTSLEVSQSRIDVDHPLSHLVRLVNLVEPEPENTLEEEQPNTELEEDREDSQESRGNDDGNEQLQDQQEIAAKARDTPTAEDAQKNGETQNDSDAQNSSDTQNEGSTQSGSNTPDEDGTESDSDIQVNGDTQNDSYAQNGSDIQDDDDMPDGSLIGEHQTGAEDEQAIAERPAAFFGIRLATDDAADDAANDEPEFNPQSPPTLVVPVNEQLEIRNTSMSGSGAFASRELKYEEVIMVERYLIEGDQATLFSQFEELDPLGQRAYLCLHPHRNRNHVNMDVLSAICHTNSFSINGGKAVFPVASRFNHHCKPGCNVNFFYDSVEKLLVLWVGVDSIKPGEELTISYGGDPRSLYDRFGFHCTCGDCKGYTPEQAEADYNQSWLH